MKTYNTLAIVLILLMHVSINYAQTLPRYISPMPIALSVSGSYAEMRANHFHSGIDLTTSGATGIKIFAVADGFVSRIKVSPYGYGYALYIDHPEGYTTVYGHLKGYSARIDSVVRAEQYRQRSFAVDMYLKPEQLPVYKGEVVAFSGNTGSSGGPHLHFEVRDTKTEEPLNPLAFMSPLTDTVPPRVYGVKLYALDDYAQVAGRSADKYFALADINGRTVEAYGKVGFGVHAIDNFVGGGRPCGVVEIALYKNDSLMFMSHIDRFTFDETRYINSHIDYAERARNRRFVQKSYVEPNNKLRIYKKSSEFFAEEGKTYKMRYVLKDFKGNTTQVSFNVLGKKKPNVAPKKHSGEFVDFARTWVADTLGMSVLIPRESLYKNEYITLSSRHSDALKQTVYTVGQTDIPLHKSLIINIPVPENIKADKSKLFVGQVDAKGRMTYLGGKFSEGKMEVQCRTFGSFAVGVDTVPPVVRSRNSRTTLVDKNSVMVGISDNISGISEYNCYIDGQWKIFEYDYKQAMLKAVVSTLGLSKGPHELEAVVKDACGNEGRMRWKFNVQ